MSEKLEMLNDDDLDVVSGGLLSFEGNVLNYYQPGTSNVMSYKILNYDAAWEMSNQLHAENWPEDYIVMRLYQNGYIGV